MQIAHFKRSAAATLLAAFSLCSEAQDVLAVSPFTSLKVFGDSLSDGGNNFLATGGAVGGVPTSNSYVPSGAPYASGTYSNGQPIPLDRDIPGMWLSTVPSHLRILLYSPSSLSKCFRYQNLCLVGMPGS